MYGPTPLNHSLHASHYDTSGMWGLLGHLRLPKSAKQDKSSKIGRLDNVGSCLSGGQVVSRTATPSSRPPQINNSITISKISKLFWKINNFTARLSPHCQTCQPTTEIGPSGPEHGHWWFSPNGPPSNCHHRRWPGRSHACSNPPT